MQLYRFLGPLRIAGVVTQLGRMLRLYGALQLVPAAVAAGAGELRVAGVVLASALICAAAGSLAARLDRHDIGLREGLVVTALSYLLCAVAGAAPYLTVCGPLDALFESTSGLTTTGLTVLPLERAGTGLLFHRAYSQWIGGGGIVVLTLAVLLRASPAAHRLYASEFGQERLVGSVVATARAIARVYLVVTAAAAGLLVATGLSVMDAALLGLTTVSTGGFAPTAASVGAVPSPWTRSAVALVMLGGATSFVLFSRLPREGVRQLLRDPQARLLVALAVVGALLMAAAGEPLGDATFHAVSALTTTGFTLTPPAGWTDGEQLLAVMLMVLGGSAGSTAGGLKLWRVVLIWRMARLLVVRALLPREARLAVRYGGEPVGDDDLRQAATLALVYLALLAGTAGALAAAGAAAGDAVFEAASALGTVGLSSGLTGPGLDAPSKLVLMLGMWLGRLEILPVLVVLYPGTWKLR